MTGFRHIIKWETVNTFLLEMFLFFNGGRCLEEMDRKAGFVRRAQVGG